MTKRVDENAPPAHLNTRSKSSNSILTSTTAENKILTRPTALKRNASSNPSSASGPTKEKGGVMKRSALGEVTNARKNENDKITKVKVKEEVKGIPLTRQTRASLAAAISAGSSEKLLPPKRKTNTNANTTTTTHTTHSKIPITSKLKSNVVDNYKLQDIKINVPLKTEDLVEPVRKKRKTSSPALVELNDEEVKGDVEVDELDEALYDEDGKEVLLSDDLPKGLKSPKLEKGTVRAKDEGWTDLDAEDEGDPTMVSEYVIDAFNYMISIEVSQNFSLFLPAI